MYQAIPDVRFPSVHVTTMSISIAADVSGNHVLELKLKALILDQIHAIDVIDKIMVEGVTRLEQWEWNKQLR